MSSATHYFSFFTAMNNKFIQM